MVTVSSTPYDPSSASLRPLKRMYADATWNPDTGRMEPAYPDPDTLAAAVERGVMFDNRRDQNHDAWVRDAKSAVARRSASRVSEARHARCCRLLPGMMCPCSSS